MRYAGSDVTELRTTSPGFHPGHGGANAEFAGFVTGGCDDAPIGAATDDEGLAAQTGIIALFN